MANAMQVLAQREEVFPIRAAGNYAVHSVEMDGDALGMASIRACADRGGWPQDGGFQVIVVYSPKTGRDAFLQGNAVRSLQGRVGWVVMYYDHPPVEGEPEQEPYHLTVCGADDLMRSKLCRMADDVHMGLRDPKSVVGMAHLTSGGTAAKFEKHVVTHSAVAAQPPWPGAELACVEPGAGLSPPMALATKNLRDKQALSSGGVPSRRYMTAAEPCGPENASCSWLLHGSRIWVVKNGKTGCTACPRVLHCFAEAKLASEHAAGE